jgi:nucleoside-diphosphate-sugar epimerase
MISPVDAGAVLITGATGFIGRHITRYLAQTGRRVIALARSQDGRTAEERLQSILGLRAANGRLQVLDSDLARPDAGLAPSQLERLRANVEIVIYCAGDTNFFPEKTEASRAVFIDAPLALLQALGSGRLGRWCHMSTAFVCGQRSGTIFEHETDVGQTFHNPYEQIKLQSEAALKVACRRSGTDLTIFRPSIVVGPDSVTRGAQPANLLFQFIRLAATVAKRVNGTVRIPGRPSARFNIVPVEHLSAAIAALADEPEAAGKTVHLVVSEPPSQNEMLQMIASRVGARGLTMVDGDRPIADRSPLELKVARMLAPYRDYLQQDVRFDDTAARALFGRVGIVAPKLDGETVDRLVDVALSATRAIGVNRKEKTAR